MCSATQAPGRRRRYGSRGRTWAPRLCGSRTRNVAGNNNATFRSYVGAWKGGVLAPAYATNFYDTLSPAIYWTQKAASLLRTPGSTERWMGASIQSWYWRTRGPPPTQAEATTLISNARGYGARIYQIEGRPDDADWGSPYMNGIADFANKVWIVSR